MAAGSTETAFTSSNAALGCFNANILKNGSPKYWKCNDGEIMAIASTEYIWEDDLDAKIKKRVLDSKCKYHFGRQLQVKHLPRDVTEDEIRELLCDYPVQNVHILNGSGSSMARATLEDPEMLEDWDKTKSFQLRGQAVPVGPTHTEMMLCVARLPFQYTEDQFTELIRTYGEIKRHFLMISEKTGESKGYGFVEYTSKDCAVHAKSMLDKKQIDGWTLVCDWLESSHVTFESLHSKCLYVDNLPKDFRDMSEFRKIFAKITNPPYCQIALKNGCPQDWGLVEFNTWEDAEAAQTTLNGYSLNGQQIRISYYIPGVHAITLYLKLLNEPGPKGKSDGLLPDPSNQCIAQSLQNLFKQNPVFAHNLHTIIMGQIHQASTGESVDVHKKLQGSAPHVPPVNGNIAKDIPSVAAIGDNGLHMNMRPGDVLNGAGPSTNNGGLHTNANSPQANQPGGAAYLSTSANAQKIPLLITPTHVQRVNLSSPSAAEVSAVPDEAYWSNLLSRIHPAPPQAHPVNGFAPNVPPPPPMPPQGGIRMSAEPTARPFSMPPPPPNFIPDIRPLLDSTVELQTPNVLNLLSSTQNMMSNQLLAGLPTTATAPSYPYALPTMRTGVDGWGVNHHLNRSLLTSPLSLGVPKPPMFSPANWATTAFLPSAPQPQPIFAPFSRPGIVWSQAPTLIPAPQATTMMTPIGQKRRLLPSPEPSPEGNYIGQHSQGLGGHYADSFFKKKKKN